MTAQDPPATFKDLADLQSRFTLLMTVLLRRDPDLAGELLEHVGTLSRAALAAEKDEVWLFLSRFESEIQEIMEE
ncbi:hypothetical protein AB9K41_07670 [Cribrihabitans sp. XS_ASV171]